MIDQRYVGPADIHDARIISISRDNKNLIVNIRSYGGRKFGVRFFGGRETQAKEFEGMMLYALVERGSDTPKQCVFVNRDENDSGSLEVTADGFEVIDG
jgi:hypothetical protein